MNQGFADVSLGQGVLVLCLAAMKLGEVILPHRISATMSSSSSSPAWWEACCFNAHVWALRAGIIADGPEAASGHGAGAVVGETDERSFPGGSGEFS